MHNDFSSAKFNLKKKKYPDDFCKENQFETKKMSSDKVSTYSIRKKRNEMELSESVEINLFSIFCELVSAAIINTIIFDFSSTCPSLMEFILDDDNFIKYKYLIFIYFSVKRFCFDWMCHMERAVFIFCGKLAAPAFTWQRQVPMVRLVFSIGKVNCKTELFCKRKYPSMASCWFNDVNFFYSTL